MLGDQARQVSGVAGEPGRCWFTKRGSPTGGSMMTAGAKAKFVVGCCCVTGDTAREISP